MVNRHVSYYHLANEGIDPQTLQRIRHDQPHPHENIGPVMPHVRMTAGELVEYLEDGKEDI